MIGLLIRLFGALFSKPTPAVDVQAVGAAHERMFPHLCKLGERSDALARAGEYGKAEEGYKKIMTYLAVNMTIDQFLLGKSYLGLLVSAAQTSPNRLPDLLRGELPLPGLGGPCLHVFKSNLLSSADQATYESIRNGSAPKPSALTAWDLSAAQSDRFPVLKLKPGGGGVVITVLEKSNPPKVAPGEQDLEIDIQVVPAPSR